MYVANGRSWYTRNGEQRSRGAYLVLAFPRRPDALEGGNMLYGTWVQEARPNLDTGLVSTVSVRVGVDGERRQNSDDWQVDLRAFVRHTELRQLGHFMCGGVTLHTAHGEVVKVHVEGGYGDNGLPVDLRMDVWDRGVRVPARLGWALAKNEPGAAAALRTWAAENHRALSRAGSKPVARRELPAYAPRTATAREKFEAAYRRIRAVRSQRERSTPSMYRAGYVDKAAKIAEPWRAKADRNPATRVVTHNADGVTTLTWRQQNLWNGMSGSYGDVDEAGRFVFAYVRDGKASFDFTQRRWIPSAMARIQHRRELRAQYPAQHEFPVK